MNPTTLTITTGQRPPTANNRQHWTKERANTQPWRDHTWAAWAQQGRPRHNTATITITAHYPKKPIPDPDNLAKPTGKAIIDTLTHIGAIPDDNPNHITAVTYQTRHTPTYTEPTIELTLTPTNPTPGHEPGQCNCATRRDQAAAKAALTRNRK